MIAQFKQRERGQAMVFGLLFMAVAIVVLLNLYNQGQLIKSRVQVENAADAAVYSQAKLAARNANFIAYTNRAMVANEVSIGQMVAMVSWARAYGTINDWTTSFPLYQFPIAPPSPVTFGQALTGVMSPYIIMGKALEKPAQKMTDIWPKVVSYFNLVLGVYQKMFVLATIEAQIEKTIAIIDDHEFTGPEGRKDELYMPLIGWFFLTLNNVMTFFAGEFDPGTLIGEAAANKGTATETGAELASDFLGDQGMTLDSFINNNQPTKIKRGGTVDNNDDDTKEAYHRFAAIVNLGRDEWTKDRHWDFGVGADIPIPAFTLDFGIVSLTIDLDLGFWTGFKKDGGTAYTYAAYGLPEEQELESFGWSSIDVFSFGVEFYIGLFVKVKICVISCTSFTLLDLDFTIPLGFPLGGATHQVVSDRPLAKYTMLHWGFPGINLIFPIMDDVYGNAFDPFHIMTFGWGNVVPPMGMYGTNPDHIGDKYGGPPGFLSLGGNFQESRTSYEMTVAVAKKMENIETTDSENYGATIPADDRDSTNYARIGVLETHSGADNSAYKRFIWGADSPMMTVSSAEVYYQNKDEDPDNPEIASLYSPYWDARLREPSWITMMFATGEIPWEKFIPSVGSGKDVAVFVIRWILGKIGEKLVEEASSYAASKADPPADQYVEKAVSDVMTPLMEEGVDAAGDMIEDQLPDF
jgi:hypothetical protein